MITQEQTVRFKDAPWFPKNNESVLIGGAGGISSWLALWLTRATFNVTVIDFDVIEEINMAGQFFGRNNLQQPKVVALKNNIHLFTNTYINVINGKIDENTEFINPYTFSGFDNMKARKDLFIHWKKSITGLNHPIFIDGRLEGENLQIFCVTPDKMNLYEENHLFDDNLVTEGSCTMRQTTHTAAMISSYMTAFFTNHITNVYQEDLIREVPFFTEIFLPLNLKIDNNE